jgi:phosphoribosylformylglycinamidine synthase
MVLSVPPANWEEFHALCQSEGVEATVIGVFTTTHQLVLKYQGTQVADLSMKFLHDGRPPVIRQAVYSAPKSQPLAAPRKERYDEDLKAILGSLNVCSKEWIIRQYDHEVLAGSVVKPLVGASSDGPSDAAVVRPDLNSSRGLVIACGMNPRLGDYDTYWMAASAIDEALRNCVAVGADPRRIAILDNFCWGNTDKPETLGSLVRAALACKDVAIAFGTPFISGKDSLYNEFSYFDEKGTRQTVAIPPSLLISALGQMEDIERAVTMDLKAPGNRLFLAGATKEELGGSHWAMVNNLTGGEVPRVDLQTAPKIFAAVHGAIASGCVRSCHDLSEGGLAAALAEMAFAGEFGIEVSLDKLAASSGISQAGILLFSESNTRFVFEVPAEKVQKFTRHFQDLPLAELGTVTENNRVRITGPTGESLLIDTAWPDLKASWQHPLDWG